MKAITYERYSPRRLKKGQDPLSNEVQHGRNKAWCALKGHEIIADYQDELASGGSIAGREAFQKALEHVKRIKGLLVCYSMSRFARSAKDALNTAHELERAGAHLALLDMDLDTSTATGRVMFTVFAAFAQFQREIQNETTSDHMQAQQASGKRMSRFPPIGKKLKHCGFKVDADGNRSARYILVDCPLELHKIVKIKERQQETGLGPIALLNLLRRERFWFRGRVVGRKAVEKALKFEFPPGFKDTFLGPSPTTTPPASEQSPLPNSDPAESASG